MWWVPTGYLTLFPFHAAGYGTDGRNTLDRVISSYSPTIRALGHSRVLQNRMTTKASPHKILMIAMSETPKRHSLPFALQEVEVIDSLVPKSIERQVFPMPTKSCVVEALGGCSIVHFSCHGSTDPDPSKSHILLADWETAPLCMADIVALNLETIQLAYFPACHSANIADNSLLDEAIHLASACQLAGIPSVIGTLWHVTDSQSAELAELFYRYIFSNEQVHCSRSAKGLHLALRRLRDDSRRFRVQNLLDSALTWAPYIHVGI
jgi:CHAT domain-containing protein